jgi:long-subunit acyl-CoA synthetase (AMP-forming)
MGIFSENRPEWIETELACCGDSICILPLVVEEKMQN